jgi:hypothetical protein
MRDRSRLVLKVVASAVVLAVAALAGWFLFGSAGTVGALAPEESPAARRERRDERREEQAARLRQALEAKRKRALAWPGESAPAALPIPEDRSPERLTGAEKAALLGAMERFYSPERLRDALANRTAPDLVREMSRSYGETFGAESLGGPADPVPVTPAVREALQRMGLLKDYGMNVLHAQRGEGEGEAQRRMVEKINRSFAERFDGLNAEYPFLGARLLEP